ncbi:MAG: universal stress protein [Chloroflexi bacterium]|nr:universal stress protein [Chloroflexota bacterium]
MYQRILIPLDGSLLSEAVLPYAEALAAASKAQVTMVYVGEPDVEERSPKHQVFLDQVTQQVVAYGKSYLRQQARRFEQKGIQTKVEVLLGRAADEITEYAQKEGVDLVAMATHGRTGLARWRYGSVANEVRNRLPMPLLLIHPTEEHPSEAAMAAREPLLLRVVVPLDGSEVAEQALPHAKELASRMDLEMHLLRIVSRPAPAYVGPEAVEYYYDLETELVKVATEYLQGVQKSLEAAGMRVTARVFHGYPAENIVDFAKALDQSIICLTTHGRTGLGRVIMGSVAEKVLHDATEPIFLVRAQASS